LLKRDVLVERRLCWNFGWDQVEVTLWMEVWEGLECVYKVACGV
jgi:hypothetical protein